MVIDEVEPSSSSFCLCLSFCLSGDNGSEWVKHWVKGGHNYYYNLQTNEGTWVEPEGFLQNNTQLNKDDIQVRPPLQLSSASLWLFNAIFNRLFSSSVSLWFPG